MLFSKGRLQLISLNYASVFSCYGHFVHARFGRNLQFAAKSKKLTTSQSKTSAIVATEVA